MRGRVRDPRRDLARVRDERVLSQPARADRPPVGRRRHRAELARRVPRLRRARHRHRVVRHPERDRRGSGAGYGALFGFCVYSVYDLTNFSTLAQYPLALALVDTAWGTFATAVCASAVRAIYGHT
jgi:hypothetical protein